ncbi:MAG: DinB family protein [Caldilineaceae bacterium]
MNHQLADQLQAAYDSLWRTLDLLDANELETGRLESNWTPKALLAHVAFWDDYQRQRMEAALQGTSAQSGFLRPTVDNDERAAVDDHRPWAEVVAAADEARQRLIDFARVLDPAVFIQEYPEGERTLWLQKLLEQMVRHPQQHAQELYSYAGSMQRWSRADLRAFLIHQHNNLMDGIGGLTETTMLATQVCGAWSIRDVLTHVLAWNEFAHVLLEGWPAVAPAKLEPWRGDDDTDALNARLLAARSHLTMIDICDGLMTYHRRILRAFDRASEEQLRGLGDYGWGEQGSLSALFYSFALHEAEHAADIWRFRADQVGQD